MGQQIYNISHGAADLQHYSHGAAKLPHSSHVVVVLQHTIHVAHTHLKNVNQTWDGLGES